MQKEIRSQEKEKPARGPCVVGSAEEWLASLRDLDMRQVGRVGSRGAGEQLPKSGAYRRVCAFRVPNENMLKHAAATKNGQV